MESWSKFHERHGSDGPKPIYGSYVTDTRQYGEHMNNPENKQPVFRRVMSCLGCLVGGGGIFRSKKGDHLNMHSYSYDVDNSQGYYGTDTPYAVRKSRFAAPARKNQKPLRGNISYLQ